LVSTRYLVGRARRWSQVQQLLPLVVPELPVDDGPKVLKGYTEFEPK